MRKRPLTLILCSLLFLFYPITWLWKMNEGFPLVLGDFIFSFVIPVLLLIGLIRVVKLGWYTLIAFGFLWGIRDIYMYYAVQGVSLIPIFVHLLIYMLSLSYFINPRIRHLYFDPKARWWRTKQRYETHAPLIVRNDGVWHYPVLRNISEGGCFIEMPQPLNIEETVAITLALPIPLNVPVIEATGEVRWVSKQGPRAGMGIQFKDLPRQQQKAVNTFVKKQL